MKAGETVLFGMALGAGLMYLLDPDRGGRRRALLRDQLTRAGHDLEELTTSSARRVRNRAAGLAHEARAGLTERDVDDRIVVERVRSELGRAVSHAHGIEVESYRGHVTLTGNIHPDEVNRLVRAVKGVRGVESVDNQLRTGEPDTSETQGAPGH
jgi:osmotically-inducible protein OsmY